MAHKLDKLCVGIVMNTLIAFPAPAVNGLRLRANTLPSFWVQPPEDGHLCDEKPRAWAQIMGDLADHPSRTAKEKDAVISLRCVPWGKNVSSLLNLPKRSKSRPYLFWGPMFAGAWTPALRAREDFLLTSPDLRLGLVNEAEPRPGVTFPTLGTKAGRMQWHDPEAPAKYFLTFQGMLRGGHGIPRSVGHNGSHIRTDLDLSFAQLKHDGVIVNIFDHRTKKPQISYDYSDLMNSTFVLVPAGHRRWSYRLSEAIESCAIPVIMADGLTLPFEELIDWANTAVVLKEQTADPKELPRSLHAVTTHRQARMRGQVESYFANAQLILDQLPKDPQVIRTMRRNACNAGARFFGTAKNRLEALLWAASVHNGIVKRAEVLQATAHNNGSFYANRAGSPTL